MRCWKRTRFTAFPESEPGLKEVNLQGKKQGCDDFIVCRISGPPAFYDKKMCEEDNECGSTPHILLLQISHQGMLGLVVPHQSRVTEEQHSAAVITDQYRTPTYPLTPPPHRKAGHMTVTSVEVLEPSWLGLPASPRG